MSELSTELWSNEILAFTFLGCHALAFNGHLWRHKEEVDKLDEGRVYHLQVAQERSDTRRRGWGRYFSYLAKLYSISK
jgi:hypothetical protein